jgi:glycosyltransferase involved in cell wall biosynthesis
MVRIPAYCLDWHIIQSRAFYELLVEPLKSFANIELTAWDGRNNAPLQHLKSTAFKEPVVFCQRPPTSEILSAPGAKLIWIPMWDNVAVNWVSDEWWASLPKSLRVVALSEKVAQKAGKAGLPTLSLRYHKDPSLFDEVSWRNGRTLFYWNRTGLFGPNFMKKLCTILDVQELYFRGSVDPKIAGDAAYDLPSKIGKTIVHKVSRFDSQEDYFELLRRCNLYLAPRALEGVGLTFLEAMAGGCTVMAYNAPTMNEYIRHGEDGLLFNMTVLEKEETSAFEKAGDVFQAWSEGRKRKNYPDRVSLFQDWGRLKSMDLELLGRTARANQAIGFHTWKKRIPEFADFVLNW